MSELLKSVEKLPLEPTLPRLSLNDFRGGNQLPTWDVPEQEFHLGKKYPLVPMVFKNWELSEPDDLVLKLGTRQIRMNRLRFMCYSKFAMDHVKGGQRELVLPEDRVPDEGLVRACHWLNQPVAKLERGSIMEVLAAALYLEVDSLIKQVWFSLNLVDEFNEDQAFAVSYESRRLRHLLPVVGLDKTMLHRIQRFFLTLVASVEFVELPFEHVHYLISSENVAVNSEMEMLYVAVRWLTHDWKARAEYAMTLIKLVSLMSLPFEYIMDLQAGRVEEPVKYITELEEFPDFIYEAFTNHLLMEFDDGSRAIEQLRELFKVELPMQRPFICDNLSGYHRATPDDLAKVFSYEDFLDYLRVIHKNGIYSWKTLDVQHTSSRFKMV
ncbi:kelch-like protein 26 [Drosophila mojavensis]|nr:kelch-like protein 26 [Drosophila mojavensis]